MSTTDRIKKLIASKAKVLPILDPEGVPAGFSDTDVFLTDGLRLAARISLANGTEDPVKQHCQTLYWRRGADDYAKNYVRTIYALQSGFFQQTLDMLQKRVGDAGDIRPGFVAAFDNEDSPQEPCS